MPGQSTVSPNPETRQKVEVFGFARTTRKWRFRRELLLFLLLASPALTWAQAECLRARFKLQIRRAGQDPELMQLFVVLEPRESLVCHWLALSGNGAVDSGAAFSQTQMVMGFRGQGRHICDVHNEQHAWQYRLHHHATI